MIVDVSDADASDVLPDGEHDDERRRHAHTILKVILSAQLVLALLTVGGVYLAYAHLNGNIAQGERIDHKAQKAGSDGPGEPLNILVLGSDSRVGKGNNIDGQTNIGQRADTTILLHVSADRREAYGVSLPRDAIVDRPECDLADKTMPAESDVMFNTAFTVGGAQCAVQTVEELTGIYIDHFVVLDFNGFKDMVDAIDGVEVCIPKDVDDDRHNIHFTAGTQTLEGQQALNYVRERYVLSVTGDIGRMKRQQAFIASMVNKAKSANVLSQPTKLYGFIDAVTSSIKVDDGLDSVGKLYDLATQFRHTGLEHIKFITVPNAPYEPDPNRLVWTDDAKKLWKRIMHDEPLGKMFSEGSLSADEPVAPTESPSESPSGSPSESPSGLPTTPPSASPTDGPGLSEQQAQEREDAGLCA